MNYYPFGASGPSTVNWHYGSGVTSDDLDKIRTLVREEVRKALHPEESRPSASVECKFDGKRYKGTVYQVEDEEEED